MKQYSFKLGIEYNQQLIGPKSIASIVRTSGDTLCEDIKGLPGVISASGHPEGNPAFYNLIVVGGDLNDIEAFLEYKSVTDDTAVQGDLVAYELSEEKPYVTRGRIRRGKVSDSDIRKKLESKEVHLAETLSKMASGGKVYYVPANQKVKGIYTVTIGGTDVNIEVVGFEKQNDKEIALYQSDPFRGNITGLVVKNTAIANISKGKTVEAISPKTGEKVKIKRVADLGTPGYFDQPVKLTMQNAVGAIIKRKAADKHDLPLEVFKKYSDDIVGVGLAGSGKSSIMLHKNQFNKWEIVTPAPAASDKLEEGGRPSLEPIESKNYPGQYTFGEDTDGDKPMYTKQELDFIKEGYQIELEFNASRRTKVEMLNYQKELNFETVLTESENEFGGSWRIWRKSSEKMAKGGPTSEGMLRIINQDPTVITGARITAQPKSIGDDMPQVFVTINGHEQYLFEYYPDEISFIPEEFIGLTIEEARSLKFEKDKEYLQSHSYSGGGATRSIEDSIKLAMSLPKYQDLSLEEAQWLHSKFSDKNKLLKTDEDEYYVNVQVVKDGKRTNDGLIVESLEKKGYGYEVGDDFTAYDKLFEFIHAVRMYKNNLEGSDDTYAGGGDFIQTADLYMQEGVHDKEYHLQIVRRGSKFAVVAQWGRRGSHLQEDEKGVFDTLPEAQHEFIKVKRSKLAKGYEDKTEDRKPEPPKRKPTPTPKAEPKPKPKAIPFKGGEWFTDENGVRHKIVEVKDDLVWYEDVIGVSEGPVLLSSVLEWIKDGTWNFEETSNPKSKPRAESTPKPEPEEQLTRLEFLMKYGY